MICTVVARSSVLFITWNAACTVASASGAEQAESPASEINPGASRRVSSTNK